MALPTPFVIATVLVLGMGVPMHGLAQPWLHGRPAGTEWSPLTPRHPHMPSLDSLVRIAPDADRPVLPKHGGLNDEGRPVWAHQMRRMMQSDTSRTFTGWTRKILVDSPHRWRFQRYFRGWLVEQVSYYEDGTADHHFHNDTTGNMVGSQRMWFSDGRPYLDQFHDASGDLHGRQMRWQSDGSINWDTRFDHGVEVDDNGRPVPEDQRTFPSSGDGC